MGAFAILGICDEHSASAALQIDGKIVAAVAEERFIRRKNSCGFPRSSIGCCLKIGAISPSDLTLVVLAGRVSHPLWHALRRQELFSTRDYLEEQDLYWSQLPAISSAQWKIHLEQNVSRVAERTGRAELLEALERWRDVSFEEAIRRHAIERRQTIAMELGIDVSRVLIADHHKCHSAYGYFSSTFRGSDTLVATMDASGDGINSTLSVGDADGLAEVFRTSNCQIGRLYRAMTLRLGFRPDDHEYKIMGLAGYASSADCVDATERISGLLQSVDGLEFRYRGKPVPFERLFPLLVSATRGLRFDSLAGAIQEYTENTIAEWVENALERYACTRLVFSGGCALNVKVNGVLSRLPRLKGFFVPPGAGDESNSIGAAYIGGNQIQKHLELPTDFLQPLEHPYLGPELSRNAVSSIVAQVDKNTYSVDSVRPRRIARDLLAGKIVGRCAGRGEFGPRALGNRSILMDPCDLRNVEALNYRTKGRDFWMPFAPVLHARDATSYFELPYAFDGRFMTMGCQTKVRCREEAPAAIHRRDLTARPQLVGPGENVGLEAVLDAFITESSRRVLLNTSLNVHGEPIVNDVEGAVSLLEEGRLDALILEDAYLARHSERNSAT